MKFPRNAKIFRGQLEAAPLAGVFFLLVIFMLLNSNLVLRPGVRIELPDDAGHPWAGVPGPTAVVSMDLNGQRFYESQAIQEKELAERLRAAVRRHPDLTLVIQLDKAVTVGDYFRLCKLANKAGIRATLLAARPEAVDKQLP